MKSRKSFWWTWAVATARLAVIAASLPMGAPVQITAQSGTAIDSLHVAPFVIALEPPGHIHAFRQASLTFKVRTGGGEPLPGLSPIIAYRSEGSERVRETREGNIVDNGNGTYTWERSFNDASVHVLTFKFEHDEIVYSNSFPLEISKAGGERIFCPEENPRFNYQIRWEMIPGHVHSGDEATFRIELKRSINEPVNTERPWRNTFDPLSPNDLKPTGALPTVAISSANGEVSPTVEYRGTGIYEAKHIFGPVDERATYWLHVTFEDDCGKVDESGQADRNYQFPVSPAHR